MKLFGEKLEMGSNEWSNTITCNHDGLEIMIHQQRLLDGSSRLLDYTRFSDWLEQNDERRVMSSKEVFSIISEALVSKNKNMVNMYYDFLNAKPEYLNLSCQKMGGLIRYFKTPMSFNGKKWKCTGDDDARFMMHDVADGMNRAIDILEKNPGMVNYLFDDILDNISIVTDTARIEIPTDDEHHAMYFDFPNICLVDFNESYALRGVREK